MLSFVANLKGPIRLLQIPHVQTSYIKPDSWNEVNALLSENFSKAMASAMSMNLKGIQMF